MKKNYTYLSYVLALVFIVSSFVSTTAQSDQYLHFNRDNQDNVLLENGSQYIADAEGFTMAGWFYTDELAYGQGMMGFRGGSSECYIIQLDNGFLECRYIPNGNFYEVTAPNFTIVAEQWQHIAWVFDGSSIELFVDGNSAGSAAAAGTFDATDVNLVLGESVIACCDFFYGGRMDEFTLWSKALTQSEIQGIMENELSGTEDGLEVYYEFNQGVPDGDNSSITHLRSTVGNGERDAVLNNFTLTGETSNFSGELDEAFQAISFPQIPNKLVSDVPFELEASASSGLAVVYEIVSGPATISGSTVTLTGEAGEVQVRASQPGDDTFDPAEALVNSFQVLDPGTHVPVIEGRNPLSGDVHVPNLAAIQLAAISTIEYPELFQVANLEFEIDGEVIAADDWNNGHYTAWWTPPAYGTYTLTIRSANNFGTSTSTTLDLNITADVADMNNVEAVSDVWLNTVIATETVTAELPSYLGAFDRIVANFDAKCPPGGCGEWDRVASVDVKGHNGQWVEIFRYITPYGTACSHSIDLTDYMSILQGKVDFRVNCVTFDNGYEYDLSLDYQSGTPEHVYSHIDVLWQETYDFGNPANLQPVQPLSVHYSSDAVASTLKMVSNGHGWGDNNTDNAAEFHEDTHTIWVNGEATFEQHNWKDCNPNPDACQPQAGTWFHDRAGWCPGAISEWFDFDMTEFIAGGTAELQYIFNEDYVDNCHVNNPNCVSGVTCPDCNDGFNPHLIVATNLVTFYDGPFDAVNIKNVIAEDIFTVYPNPSNGLFEFSTSVALNKASLRIFDFTGKLMMETNLGNVGAAYTKAMDLRAYPKGVYSLVVQTTEGVQTRKLVIE